MKETETVDLGNGLSVELPLDFMMKTAEALNAYWLFVINLGIFELPDDSLNSIYLVHPGLERFNYRAVNSFGRSVEKKIPSNPPNGLPNIYVGVVTEPEKEGLSEDEFYGDLFRHVCLGPHDIEIEPARLPHDPYGIEISD